MQARTDTYTDVYMYVFLSMHVCNIIVVGVVVVIVVVVIIIIIIIIIY